MLIHRINYYTLCLRCPQHSLRNWICDGRSVGRNTGRWGRLEAVCDHCLPSRPTNIGVRRAFLIQVPATCLAILCVSVFLHPPPLKRSGVASPTDSEVEPSVRSKLKQIDWTGAFLLVSAVLCLLLALDRGAYTAPTSDSPSNSDSTLSSYVFAQSALSTSASTSQFSFISASSSSSTWTSPLTLSFLVSSIALFIIFGLVESKYASYPFAPPRILFSPSLLPAYLCNLLGIASSTALVFHVPLFFQAVFHSSAREAGLVLLPGIFSSVMGSLGSGLWMRKTGRYRGITIVAYTLMLVGSIGLAIWLKLGRGFAGVVVMMFLSSLGNGALALVYVSSLPSCLDLFPSHIGTGLTTTLIALIANAAPEDQAVATASKFFPIFYHLRFPEQLFSLVPLSLHGLRPGHLCWQHAHPGYATILPHRATLRYGS